MTYRLSVSPEDVADMTVAELELLEEKAGRPLSTLFAPDAPRGVVLHALAYIMLRRDDPSITWEQAGESRVELATDDADEPDGVTSNGSKPTRPRRLVDASRRG